MTIDPVPQAVRDFLSDPATVAFQARQDALLRSFGPERATAALASVMSAGDKSADDAAAPPEKPWLGSNIPAQESETPRDWMTGQLPPSAPDKEVDWLTSGIPRN